MHSPIDLLERLIKAEQHLARIDGTNADQDQRTNMLSRRLDALTCKVAYLDKRYRELDDAFASAINLNLDTIRLLEERIDLLEHKIDAMEVVG